MIKIIRHGENAPSRRVECHNCGCIFEYQKSDMQMLCTAGAFSMYLIECPQCGNSINLPEWDNEVKAESETSEASGASKTPDLRTIKEWCDEQSWNCKGCPLNDECARMFSIMAPNVWQDSDIEAFEKEIKG